MVFRKHPPCYVWSRQFPALFAYETNMLHVIAMGAAIEHETVADNLYEFSVQFFGPVSYTHLDVYKRQVVVHPDMRHGVFRVISGFYYDLSNKISGLFRVLRIIVVS